MPQASPIAVRRRGCVRIHTHVREKIMVSSAVRLEKVTIAQRLARRERAVSILTTP